MNVEIWSDVACPWCYIGKRRFEHALDGWDGASNVAVTFRSFQLDPTIPAGFRRQHDESLAEKFGATTEQVHGMNERLVGLAAAEGLDYHFDLYIVVNTRDAHRLSHLAKARGLGAAMQERLMRAQLIDGDVLDDPETLARLGAEVGLDAEEVRSALASDAYADAVDDAIRLARELGVNGVPFFVFDRRFAVSGAQSSDVFRKALEAARDEAASVG